MSKPRAIRNRKSEMISCWVCAAFIAILFIGKNLLIGCSLCFGAVPSGGSAGVPV